MVGLVEDWSCNLRRDGSWRTCSDPCVGKVSHSCPVKGRRGAENPGNFCLSKVVPTTANEALEHCMSIYVEDPSYTSSCFESTFSLTCYCGYGDAGRERRSWWKFCSKTGALPSWCVERDFTR